MELHQVAEIRQVYGEQKVNDGLARGWTLVSITAGYDRLQGVAAPCYVLGVTAEQAAAMNNNDVQAE